MSFSYLASPYSHSNPGVRDERYWQVVEAVAKLMTKKIWVFSPIIYCHPMAQRHELQTDAMFWSEFNMAMLSRATDLFILTLDGWEESLGVLAERRAAAELGLRIHLITLETL